MILWCDGDHDARENMRRDAALLALAGRPEAEPVLRLFRFRPAGITLGHSQSAEKVLDLERCAADQVMWAIRPTGGRAIYHADEWTYSLAASLEDAEWGGSLREAYDRVGRLLVASFVRLSVPAEMAGAAARGAGRVAAATPCFSTSTRHEIVRAGRKFVGSAQRRTARALLQQGSVLLSDRHLALVDYLALDPAARTHTRAALERASTHIGDVVGRDAPLERWAEALEASLPPGFRRVDGPAALPLTA